MACLSRTRGASANFRILLGAGASLCALSAAAPALAQQDVATIPEQENALDQNGDTIVVTGSRIRRDEFSSPTPIQVLDPSAAAQLGVSSITELLQRATVANGRQIDATLNTNAGNSNATEAPPTGGTGSSNIDLRGLGPERTLVLINGRRLGSAGVRGAPAQPDINLLPLGLVERVEIVTEGASSIYGADAVAGVVNVILRDEFEGFELSANFERPEADGGEINQFSLTTGAVGDRASILFGAEYFSRERVSAGQRGFSSSLRDINIAAADGAIFSYDRSGFFDNSAFVSAPVTDDLGNDVSFIYHTPGSTNIGVADWSSAFALPEPDGPCTRQGDQFDFVCLDPYGDQDERRRSDLVQPIQRFSIVTTGKYELDLWANEEVYFEAYYLNRNQVVRGAIEQSFPEIPAMIPLVDENGEFVIAGDEISMVDNPLNPFDSLALPIVTLSDVPQDFTVELQQFRFVGGLRGDMGTSGWFADNNWTYDLTWSYDRGVGFQSQRILFEPHVIQATQGVVQNPDGSLSCGPQNLVSLFGFNTPPECVPFNAFASSLFETGPDGDGSFATQAEFDYLTGNRTNRTVVEQTVFAGYVTGDLWDIPTGGVAAMAMGGEWRLDSIESQNDIVGVLGLNAAENPVQEGSTRGSRNIWDLYAEVTLPLLADRPGVELLEIDGAVRYTNEEFFGDDITYRVRGLYQPNDWLQFSGSYGTSFRAPNLREQFLADQGGGIGGGADPCLVQNFLDPESPDEQFVIANCIASGVPFLDSDGNGVPDTSTIGPVTTTIPISVGGNTDIQAETSRSYTGTVVISPPITDTFDVDVAVSYFDIKINNSVNELDPEVIIDECFSNQDFPNLSSPFCSRVSRPVGTGNPQINFVDASFVNIGEETARGIDINSRVTMNAQDVFGDSMPPIDFSWATATSYLIEQEVEIFGPEDRDDNAGEIGSPEWRFSSTASLRWGNFEFLTQSRMLSATQQDNTDAFSINSEVEGFGEHRDVDFTDQYWIHDASLTWVQDAYSITAGVNNIADRDPPLIDDGEGPNRNNAVTSSGYDLFGRTFFVSGKVRF